jgi:hypothetical protein
MTPEDIKMHRAANAGVSRDAQQQESVKVFMNLLTTLFTAVGKSPSKLTTVAGECLTGLLANPDYSPTRDNGETHAEACARRACDYAEALLAEVARREQRNAEAAP